MSTFLKYLKENEDEKEIPSDEVGSEEELETDSEEKETDEPEEASVREVPGAILVSRKKNDNGLYDEIWAFSVLEDEDDRAASSRYRKPGDVLKDILSGTDIPPHKTKSDDGSQEYEIRTIGNLQMIKITGLPN